MDMSVQYSQLYSDLGVLRVFTKVPAGLRAMNGGEWDRRWDEQINIVNNWTHS